VDWARTSKTYPPESGYPRGAGIAGLVQTHHRDAITASTSPLVAGPPSPSAAGTGGRAGRSGWWHWLPWVALLTGLLVVAVTGTGPYLHRTPRAAPTLFGAPDFAGYCQATGQGGVRLNANNAYGWQCTAASSLGDDATAVCAWTFHTDRVVSDAVRRARRG
jgi:hypothetical protein